MVLHTIVIALHAACGLTAFAAGIVVLRPRAAGCTLLSLACRPART